MACAKCGGRTLSPAATQRILQTSSEDDVWLLFTGKHIANVPYRANARTYMAGNNNQGRYAQVHPDDVAPMLRHGVFELIEIVEDEASEDNDITWDQIAEAAKVTAAGQLIAADIDTIGLVEENLDQLEEWITSAAADRVRALFNG